MVALEQETVAVGGHMGPFRSRRLILILAIIALCLFPGELGHLTRDLILDAYFQVAVFVAATLMLFYGSEKLFNFDIGTVLRGSRMAQVPLAALLGTTPGCGGAVVVMAAFASGNVGFGAVVATLTATMGDAAFLLIATRPDAAIVVLPLSFAVGILSGWTVDAIGYAPKINDKNASPYAAPVIGAIRPRDLIYCFFALPGFLIGVAILIQPEVADSLPRLPLMIIGLGGTLTGLLIWAQSPLQAMTAPTDKPLTRVSEETSFIGIYVIVAYVAYDYTVTFTGLDLEAMFSAVAWLLPLIAIVIGFVPGCGPQVIVTTLYINGLIPFAALIGNAISNDGDALFPAMAVSARSAVMATLVSAIPAVIVAYMFHIFAPGFMN